MAGKLVIFSAPSGSGKTTLVRNLLKDFPNLGFSISATTREGRQNEVDGKDYYFLKLDDFKTRIEQSEFAEFEEVYPGRFYGTLKEEIQRLWDEGKDVIFDVDVKGGIRLKEVYGNQALAVFVKVPSIDVLEQRLRTRNTETEENLQTRLARVKEEMTYESRFDLTILNDNLETATSEAIKCLNDFLSTKS